MNLRPTMQKVSKMISVGTLVGAVLALSACGSADDPADGNAKAKSITVWTVAESPNVSWEKATVDDFTAKTGIEVNYQELPQAGLLDKVKIGLTSKSKDFDVYMSPTSYANQYLPLKGAASLSAFLDDPEKTPADFDVDDIPAASYAPCTVEGQTYCLPLFVGGTTLYYNKAMYAEAGIANPPASWDEVEANAARLTKGDQSGICLRGAVNSPSYYPGTLLMMYQMTYDAANKGVWLDSEYRPQLSSPEGLEFAESWANLMRNYAPGGVGNYQYADCLHAFQGARTAMWIDDLSVSSSMWNPDVDPNSKDIAADAGFHFIPCPEISAGNCRFAGSWGAYMNQNIESDKKNAAWEFIKWISSKEVTDRAVAETKDISQAIRTSTLEKLLEQGADSGIPMDLVQSVIDGSQNINPAPSPAIASWSEAQNILGQALSAIIEGKDPKKAMQEADAAVDAVFKKAGVYNK